jgi:hypothetical protein
VVIVVLVIRMIVQTKTASPPSWFFLLCGILCLVPAVFFAEAESLIIEVLIDLRNSNGIAGVASNINLFSILSIAAAPVVFILLLAISVIPFSSKVKPKWSPLITAIIVEILIIAITIAFQWRVLWLNKSYWTNL